MKKNVMFTTMLILINVTLLELFLVSIGWISKLSTGYLALVIVTILVINTFGLKKRSLTEFLKTLLVFLAEMPIALIVFFAIRNAIVAQRLDDRAIGEAVLNLFVIVCFFIGIALSLFISLLMSLACQARENRQSDQLLATQGTAQNH